MHISQRKVWWALGGVFLAALALLAIITYPEAKKRWITPLGPGLGLPSLTPALSSATEPFSASSPLAGRTDNVAPASNELQTLATGAVSAPGNLAETPQPLCGGPPSMNLLALGIDSSFEYRYGLADVIRIVQVDFVTPRVNVLSLPRDLWVEIPGLEEKYGITHGKLNQAYFYGSPGMQYYQGPGGGAGLLALTLELNFGLRVDHYGVVHMRAFTRMVDAVGGIDVYLPNEVDGRPFEDNPEDMGYFPAGQQHLNGEQALRFARIRKRYSDFVRMDNQNRVICALKEKITSPAVLPKIPEIIGALQDSVLTDLTPQQLAQMACLLPKLEPENVRFTGLPQEMLSSEHVYSPQLKDDTYILDADFDDVRNQVDQFAAGSLPAQPDEPACP